MSNNAHELSNRLLNALDSNYNVVNMQTVNEIISILEKFNITKELLETTRLGKHVNELRRKTSEPGLARRAKVLVKRWRDLVIPTTHSPAHTGSNRSSAERQVRRLGGTPLTSPALSRNLVSPAVPSPRPPSRPAWGGYESDSQDVILVDDDPPPPVAPAPPPTLPPPPPAALAHKPATPPVKRPLSPEPLYDEKKAKRDKKPKKRRAHGRAGSGTETTADPQSQHNWVSRNGSGPERRRNGWRRDPPDPYAALVNRLPPAGAKKVKTTKELLEQIQSRGSGRPSRPASPRSPASPASPDVMLIEPDVCVIKVESPLRNGGGEIKKTKAEAEPETKEEREEMPPLEDPREWAECTCEEIAAASCPAATRPALLPLHVRALHHALLPGLNGTRAPLYPHRFAVRPLARPDDPDLFSSVVPLYNYSDYADDHCVKNMSRVTLCDGMPWTDFAPSPPHPSPPPSPPPLRPYPSPRRDDVFAEAPEPDEDSADSSAPDAPDPVSTEVSVAREKPKIEPEMVGVAYQEPSERLNAPLLSADDVMQFGEPRVTVEVEKCFVSEPQEHRTVERTKTDLDGRGLYALCESAQASVPYRYEQAAAAPVLTLPQLTERDDEPPDAGAEAEARTALEGALDAAAAATERDALARPTRPTLFAEWHECARLGDLIALPYVVID